MNENGHGNNFSIVDETAFRTFFTTNFAAAVSFCRFQFELEAEEAKDVVQSAFVRLWEARETLDPALSPKAYLFTVAANICRDRLRRNKVIRAHRLHIQHTEEDQSAAVFTDISVKELSAAIQHAIQSMPEKMRQIFEMSRYQGLRYASIAAELNISVKTVETQMSRALDRLRESLSGFLGFEMLFVATLMLG